MMHTLLTIVGPLICTMSDNRRYTVRDVVFKRKVQTILQHNQERGTIEVAVEENMSIEKILS